MKAAVLANKKIDRNALTPVHPALCSVYVGVCVCVSVCVSVCLCVNAVVLYIFI